MSARPTPAFLAAEPLGVGPPFVSLLTSLSPGVLRTDSVALLALVVDVPATLTAPVLDSALALPSAWLKVLLARLVALVLFLLVQLVVTLALVSML